MVCSITEPTPADTFTRIGKITTLSIYSLVGVVRSVQLSNTSIASSCQLSTSEVIEEAEILPQVKLVTVS